MRRTPDLHKEYQKIHKKVKGMVAKAHYAPDAQRIQAMIAKFRSLIDAHTQR